MGNLEEALESFKKAYEMKPGSPMVQLNLIRAYVELAKSGKKQHLSSAEKLVNVLMQKGGIYQQEAYLMQLYIYLLKNQKDKLESSLAGFLDQNPFLSEGYRYNLFMNKQFVSWKSLSSYCSEIIANIEDSFYAKTFEGFCQAKAEEYTIAKKVIQDAMNRAPGNALVQSIYSYIFMKMGLNAEASVTLGSANKSNTDNQFRLPHVMQAKFCADSSDWECAKKEWEKVLEKNLSDISALTGLAQVSFEKGDKSAAFRYMNKAKSISEDFVPLKVIESKLDESS